MSKCLTFFCFYDILICYFVVLNIYFILAKIMIKIDYIINRKTIIAAIIIKLVISAVILATIFIASQPKEVKAAYGLDPKIKQVKTLDSSAVYYLDHKRGKKKAYANMAGFLSYGNKVKDIKIISKNELNKWPDINLVKSAKNPAVYYLKDGYKTLIKNEKEFLDLGYKWSDVVTINEVDLNSYTLTGNTNANGEISVELDASSPSGKTIPYNSNGNVIAVYKIKSLGESAQINGLNLTLSGIFSKEALKKIYLTDENDISIGEQVWRDGKRGGFDFSPNPFYISAGAARKIKVLVDFSSCPECVNHIIITSIENSLDIKTTSPVSGSYPVKSAQVKLVDADKLIGKLRVEKNAFNNSTAVIGSTAQLIGKFTVANLSTTESVAVKKIYFKNYGSAYLGQIKNFKLKDGSNKIVAQVNEMGSDKIIRFTLNDYLIDKKDGETFMVYCDIADGDGKTVNLKLDNIEAVGKDYGFKLAFDQIDTDEAVTINREYLGVTAKSLKANNKVFSNQSGVIMGAFQIRNNNKSIAFESMEIGLNKNASAPALDQTVFLVNYDTGEVFGSTQGSIISDGPIIINIQNLTLASKKDITLTLITDIPKAAKNGDYYQMNLKSIRYRAENGLYYSDPVEAPGAKLTVAKSNLFVYPNNKKGEISYTKGQKGVIVASFIIEAASGDDSTINSISFIKGSGTSGEISYANGFSNVTAYINGSRVGSVINKPFGGALTFDNFNYRLGNNGRAEIKVVADTESDLRVSETQLMITNIVATGYNSGIPTVISSINVNSLKTYFGEISADLAQVSGGSVVKGEKENLVGSFTVKNTGSETFIIRSIVLTTSSDGFSYSLGYSNLVIKENSKLIKIGGISSPVAGANKINLSYVIEPQKEFKFDVYVDADDDVPTGSFELYFGELKADGKTSGLPVNISGDPTGSVSVTVN